MAGRVKVVAYPYVVESEVMSQTGGTSKRFSRTLAEITMMISLVYGESYERKERVGYTTQSKY